MRISDWSSDVCSSDLNKVVAGNGLYQLDDELKTVGNANPKFLGGFTTDLNYKGLSLYLGFDYKFGGTIFSYSNYYLTGNGVTKNRSEEHTSELQSLMRTSYAVFCLKKKTKIKT